jgi:hypothetical protein
MFSENSYPQRGKGLSVSINFGRKVTDNNRVAKLLLYIAPSSTRAFCVQQALADANLAGTEVGVNLSGQNVGAWLGEPRLQASRPNIRFQRLIYLRAYSGDQIGHQTMPDKSEVGRNFSRSL